MVLGKGAFARQAQNRPPTAIAQKQQSFSSSMDQAMGVIFQSWFPG
jgi:hypothetical protein